MATKEWFLTVERALNSGQAWNFNNCKQFAGLQTCSGGITGPKS